MVDFPINGNIFKIGDQIIGPVAKGAAESWFAADIVIQTSDNSRGTTIVIDFSYDVTTVISYTLDGGATFVAFNEGESISGGQSRYLRVTNGNAVNFRAVTPGNLNRCIVGEV